MILWRFFPCAVASAQKRSKNVKFTFPPNRENLWETQHQMPWPDDFASFCYIVSLHLFMSLSQKFSVQNASAGCFSHVLFGFSFVLISVCQMALSRSTADTKWPTTRKPCSYIVAVFVAAICRSAERHAFGCPTRRQNKLVYVQNIRIKAYRNTNKFVSRSDEVTTSFAHLGQNVCALSDFFTCPIFGRSLIQVIFPKYLCHSSLYNCILHRTLRHLHSELHVVTWRDRSFGIRENFTEWVFEKVNRQINVLHAYSHTSFYWLVYIHLYIGILK